MHKRFENFGTLVARLLRLCPGPPLRTLSACLVVRGFLIPSENYKALWYLILISNMFGCEVGSASLKRRVCIQLPTLCENCNFQGSSTSYINVNRTISQFPIL